MTVKAIIILISSYCVFIPAKSAEAYIDLGTGSYVAQALIAAIVAWFFFLKSHWNKFKTWFNGLFRKFKDE